MAKTFSETLEELLGQIEPALKQLESVRDTAQLAELSVLLRGALVDLLVLLERDPGIEMAVADLYATAETLTEDLAKPAFVQPRRLRLFRDARARLRTCLSRARPSPYGTNLVWRREDVAV